jgi:hypothetical protein
MNAGIYMHVHCGSLAILLIRYAILWELFCMRLNIRVNCIFYLKFYKNHASFIWNDKCCCYCYIVKFHRKSYIINMHVSKYRRTSRTSVKFCSQNILSQFVIRYIRWHSVYSLYLLPWQCSGFLVYVKVTLIDSLKVIRCTTRMIWEKYKNKNSIFV